MLPARVLDAAARSPGGLLDLAQLAVLGCDRRRVAEWAIAGLLQRCAPRLYRVAHAPVPATQCLHLPLRYLARPGEAGPQALVSGSAALGLREVEGFGLPTRALVLVDRARSCRAQGLPFDLRRVRLAAIAREQIQGVDTVEVARALADAALDRSFDDRRLRVAVDAVRSRRLAATADLVSSWRRVGHEGARRLLAMAPAWEHESEGERACFAGLFGRFPPPPDCQVVLLRSLRVDFVFLFAALIVEYLGAVHDGQVDRDSTRTFALERIGYRIICVTRSMLRDADGVARHIHAVRRARERLALEGRLPRPPLPAQPPRLTPLRTLVPLG